MPSRRPPTGRWASRASRRTMRSCSRSPTRGAGSRPRLGSGSSSRLCGRQPRGRGRAWGSRVGRGWGKADSLLPGQPGMAKEGGKGESKSNHSRTDRVIEALEKEGHVTMEQFEGRYRIRTTAEGVLHIRRYNEFYRKIYQEQIRDHYRFTKAPFWLRD